MNLVIRLAGPAQSWVGYRVGHDNARTEPVPTKSGVAGLLAACLGQSEYLPLMDAFDLRVRVDRTNQAQDDLQVATLPRAGLETELWHRSALLHAATETIRAGDKIKPYRGNDINITAGTNKVVYSPSRSFIPHAEFVCHIATTGEDLGNRLVEGFHRPVFLPYLGRKANPASFPFFLGIWSNDGDVLEALPYVPRHDERLAVAPRALRVHTVSGYTLHTTTIVRITPPRAHNRDAQLTWAKEHLSR